MSRPFLTARWENLVVLNYNAPRSLLLPLVPRGTELDEWEGESLVSLVGFQFLQTRVRGLAIPGHVNFPEVNLRFYVRRREQNQWQRGVVFNRELVPRWAVTAIARLLYNEPYLTVPMTAEVCCNGQTGGALAYRWRHRGRTLEMTATVGGPSRPMVAGSEAEFILEHYWGFGRRRSGETMAYQVDHPPWRVWSTPRCTFTGDADLLYGPEFANILRSPPRSAIVAEGSAVTVFPGKPVV